MEYVEKNNYGKYGNDKNFIEVSFGHYEKDGTKYAEKLYISDKYTKGDEIRTNKSVGLTNEQAEFLYNALGKYLGKE